jgi:hypothetical protein
MLRSLTAGDLGSVIQVLERDSAALSTESTMSIINAMV